MTDKKENFIKKAFKDMAESAKVQHEVDKANFEAVRAESKASFEENRGSNTLKKAKETAKQSWEDAKMSPSERTEKIRKEQSIQVENAKKRTAEANARIEKAKQYRKDK